MEKEKSTAKSDAYLDPFRYETIANEIIEVMAAHHIDFWEVPTLLDLVKLKCRYQNQGEPLEPRL